MTAPSARRRTSAPAIWWIPDSWRCGTPDVTIRVNPDRGDLVETRMIDGTRYILIRAEEGVEVNGVQVQIP